MNSPYSFASKSYEMKVYIKLNGCFLTRRHYSHKSPAHKYITINDKNILLFVLTILNPGRTNGSFILTLKLKDCVGKSEKSCAMKSLLLDFLPLYLL